MWAKTAFSSYELAFNKHSEVFWTNIECATVSPEIDLLVDTGL